MVTAIHEHENRTPWVGTSGGGLSGVIGSNFINSTVKDALYDDRVFQILGDRNHYFWMSSNRGIFRVSEGQLSDFARNIGSRITNAYNIANCLEQ
jgi:hypothetical protein